MADTVERTFAEVPADPDDELILRQVAPWSAFRRFWLASSASVFGDQLTLVALPIATYAETGSAVAVGVVASAEGVTALVLGMVAGALADRLPHRRVLVLTDLVQAAVLVALVAALLSSGPAFVALLAGSVLIGATRVLHDGAASAVVPTIVDDERLLLANSRVHAAEAGSTAVGPAVAGVLVRVGGPPLAFLADAATFVVSAVALARLPGIDGADRPEVEVDLVAEGRSSLVADVREGLSALLGDAVMRRVVLVAAAVNVLAVCVESQFIPYAREVLGIGGLGIGAFFALGGAAAVATSFVVGTRTVARGDVLLGGLSVYAAAILVAGVAPGLVTVALAYVGAGVGIALVAVHVQAFRQRRFPVRLQGRVAMTVRALVLGALPLPLIGGGWLSDRFGPDRLFVVCGAVGVAVAVHGLFTGVGRLRAGPE